MRISDVFGQTENHNKGKNRTRFWILITGLLTIIIILVMLLRQLNAGQTVATGELAPDFTVYAPFESILNGDTATRIHSYSEFALQKNDNLLLPGSPGVVTYSIDIHLKDTTYEPGQTPESIGVLPNINSVDYKFTDYEQNKTFDVLNNRALIRYFYSYDMMDRDPYFGDYLKVTFKEKDKNGQMQSVDVDLKYFTIETKQIDSNNFEYEIFFSKLLKPGIYVFESEEQENPQRPPITFELISNDDDIEVVNALALSGDMFDPLTLKGNYAFGVDLLKIIQDTQISDIKITSDSIGPLYLQSYVYDIPFMEDFKLSTYFKIEEIDAVLEGNVITVTLRELSSGREITLKYEEKDIKVNIYENGKYIKAIGGPTVPETTYQFEFLFHLLVNDDLFNEIVGSYTIANDPGIEMFRSGSSIYYTIKETLPETTTQNSGTYRLRAQFNGSSEFIYDIPLRIKYRGYAYLSNIEFMEQPREYIYPDVYEADSAGNRKTDSKFGMRAYSEGIDYDSGDGLVNNARLIRIDGYTTLLDLTNYSPEFFEFLKRGTSVARKVYNRNGTFTYTAEVAIDSTDVQKQVLRANYDVNQITGLPQADGSRPVVEYRITNYAQVITYFITAKDIRYNVNMDFNFQYLDTNGSIFPISKSDELKDQLLSFNIFNYDTDKPVGLNQIKKIENYPTIDSLGKLNSRVGFNYYDDSNFSTTIKGNLSGYYQFLLTPIKGFDYYILYNGKRLEKFSVGGVETEGYYFYINSSLRARDRSFTIVLYDAPENDWGLVEY